eukprot:4648036-Prymnesium_polylepis.1
MRQGCDGLDATGTRSGHSWDVAGTLQGSGRDRAGWAKGRSRIATVVRRWTWPGCSGWDAAGMWRKLRQGYGVDRDWTGWGRDGSGTGTWQTDMRG